MVTPQNEQKTPLKELKDKVEFFPEHNIIWVKNFLKWQNQNESFLKAALKSIEGYPIDIVHKFYDYNGLDKTSLPIIPPQCTHSGNTVPSSVAVTETVTETETDTEKNLDSTPYIQNNLLGSHTPCACARVCENNNNLNNININNIEKDQDSGKSGTKSLDFKSDLSTDSGTKSLHSEVRIESGTKSLVSGSDSFPENISIPANTESAQLIPEPICAELFSSGAKADFQSQVADTPCNAHDHAQDHDNLPIKVKATPLPVCPQKDIIDLYHELLPELPVIRSWNKDNESSLRARWKENKERQNLEWWKDFFVNEIRASDFLMGRKTGFNCTLGWILKSSNFSKIMNGQYRARERVNNRLPYSTGCTRTDANIMAGMAFIESKRKELENEETRH